MKLVLLLNMLSQKLFLKIKDVYKNLQIRFEAQISKS